MQRVAHRHSDEMHQLRAKIARLLVELDRAKAISKSRKNKKEVAHTARDDHKRGLEYWRERAMEAETKLAGRAPEQTARDK